MKKLHSQIKHTTTTRLLWRTIAVLLLCGLIAMIFAGTAIAAETQRAKGEGTLTAVRNDGMLIIEERGNNEDGSPAIYERGYRLSPVAIVLDSQGKRTSPGKMNLPTVVKFEYVFTQQGPEIRLIREIAQ